MTLPTSDLSQLRAGLPSRLAEQNQQLAATLAANTSQLRRFIRKHVPSTADAEDLLQEVLSELVEATRLMQPIERVGAWLTRIARNRIIDRFRHRKHAALNASDLALEGDSDFHWEELLPDAGASIDQHLAREHVLQQFEIALAALPAEQRAIFIAHEFDGRSFKELAAEQGVSINTLLSRKHTAVLALREKLKHVYDDFIS